MVIGERFAWAHIPKTAGDLTLALFQMVVPDLIVEADPVTGPKHGTFARRGPEVMSKPILGANIRRLPGHALSRAHHLFSYGRRGDYKPAPMSTPEEVASSDGADRTLGRHMAGVTITFWLRMEHLREDFVRFVSQLRPLTERERAMALRTNPRKGVPDYDHDPAHFFTREQIERLYANNPLWASVEREVYGELDIPDDAEGREPGASEPWWEPFVRQPVSY